MFIMTYSEFTYEITVYAADYYGRSKAVSLHLS